VLRLALRPRLALLGRLLLGRRLHLGLGAGLGPLLRDLGRLGLPFGDEDLGVAIGDLVQRHLARLDLGGGQGRVEAAVADQGAEEHDHERAIHALEVAALADAGDRRAGRLGRGRHELPEDGDVPEHHLAALVLADLDHEARTLLGGEPLGDQGGEVGLALRALDPALHALAEGQEPPLPVPEEQRHRGREGRALGHDRVARAAADGDALARGEDPLLDDLAVADDADAEDLGLQWRHRRGTPAR